VEPSLWGSGCAAVSVGWSPRALLVCVAAAAQALAALAELFLVNGDMCAWLYTGSQVRERGGLRRAARGAVQRRSRL
jgi:hypothetical protein